MEEVRTQRLVGTRPLPRDADELHPIAADPRVVRWAFLETPTLAKTRSALVRDAVHWKRHRFGRWVWRCDRAVVAHAGLMMKGDDVELAWYVAADRWREGFGTEVARFAADYAFTTVGVDEVIALTLPDNLGSRALMERLGMTLEPDLVEHAGLPHVRYRLGAPPPAVSYDHRGASSD